MITPAARNLVVWSLGGSTSSEKLIAQIENQHLKFKLIRAAQLSFSVIDRIDYLALNQLVGLPEEIQQMMSSSIKSEEEIKNLTHDLIYLAPSIEEIDDLEIQFERSEYYIIITIPTKNPLMLSCRPHNKIVFLKAIIEKKKGISSTQQKLVRNQTVLQDNSTLEDYRIPTGEKIYLELSSAGQ